MRTIFVFTIITLICPVSAAFAAKATQRVSLVPAEQAASTTDSTPPSITITSPAVKRGVKLVASETSLTVTGRASDASGVASVTVNGQLAALDESGNFSAELLLKPGENQIAVVATDIYRNSASEKFAISREAGQAPAKPKQQTYLAAAPTGRYFALIIGNNDYQQMTRLKTPVNDAREVEKALKDTFGFETQLITNARRSDILSAMNELRKKVTASDSVLIYYAGHGEYDQTVDKSYWLPVDAQKDNTAEWIIADDVTSNIKRFASKHVLLVSDSCYSGTLKRSSQTNLKNAEERGEFLRKMQNRSSRTLMASGGNEPVADGGGTGHSIFADVFLKALNGMEQGSFTADELFHNEIKTRVAGRSDQVPEYGDIRNSGHDGGDFVFVKKQ
jgi:hypothetical protein